MDFIAVLQRKNGGRSDFAGTLRQMMPPYLLDGENKAEYLIANMDYAQVNGAVITQEYMDGNQDSYLLEVKKRYPDRIRICSLYEERPGFRLEGFDGIKICGARMKAPFETALPVFQAAQAAGKFVAVDLAEGGSDYPRTMTAVTYRMSQDFIQKSKRLSERDKRLFLGENAERFYGFGHQEELPKILNMVED